MELHQVMEQESFVIVGDTLNTEKYAYRIKQAMTDQGYRVQCVGTELASINDVTGDIDIIDLCIRPDKGLALLRDCKKKYRSVVIQPGASSEAIVSYLNENDIPYIDGCLLLGLNLYKTGNGYKQKSEPSL